MIHPAFGIVGVLVALLALLALVRQTNWSPEWQRKSVHMGMGMITLLFPWMFSTFWPVALLGLLALGAMLGLRWIPGLRESFGSALHGVERDSSGELCFVLAVVLVFWLSGGDGVAFSIPILILAFADAAGALVGRRYGQTGFATLAGTKSVEGSVFFFFICFFAALLPLTFFTDIGKVETLLIALTLAAVVTMIEATADYGLDNLLIPLGSWYLLSEYTVMTQEMLWQRFGLLAVLLILVLGLRNRTTLNGAGLLGVVLFAYACLGFGGWAFLLVPAVFFLNHLVDVARSAVQNHEGHDLWAVLSFAATGTVWLFAEKFGGAPPLTFLAPFVLGICCHFAIRCFTTDRFFKPTLPNARRMPVAVLKAVAFSYIPLLIFVPAVSVLVQALLALVLSSVAVFAFWQWYPREGPSSSHRRRWALECWLCLGCSMVAALLPLP